MAQNIARLGVVLGLTTAEFTQGLGKAGVKLAEFVDKAKPAILSVSAAMVALTAKTVAYADEITDIADANNIAVNSVMALGTALAVSGGKAENAGKLLSAFSAKVDNAAQGNEGAQKTFERLGVSLSDIANSTNEQLLDKVVKKLAEMKDPITRNALAMEAFSKAGKGIVWDQFLQQLEAGRKKYEESAEGLIAMGEAADKLAIIMKGSMATVAKAVGEDLKLVVDYIEKISDKTTGLGDVFRTVFETVAVIVSDISFIFGRFAGVFDRFSLGITASAEEVSAFWKKYKQESEDARNDLDRFQRRLLDNSPNRDAEAQKGYNDKSNSGPQRILEETKKNQDLLRVAKMLSEEYKQQQVIQLQQLAIAGQMAGMTQNELQIQQAVNAVIKSTQSAVEAISKKRADAVNANASDKVIAEYDAQITKIYELENVYIEMSRAVVQQTIATQMTFEFGWNKAFNQFAEDANNNAKLAESIFQKITGSMSSAIDKFVETGKFSFADFTKSIIQDLIKIQLRMQAMQLFSFAKKGIGDLFSATPQYADPAYAQAGYADGGDPPVGVPSLVGERGPELFVPKRSGTIIPNNQLGSVLGGGQTINYNAPYIANMQAIDTQSATQFLAKNKNAVWSANQSASRSLPASRS